MYAYCQWYAGDWKWWIITGQIQEACDEWVWDVGALSYFLEMEFEVTTKWVFMHQRKYLGDVLRRFNMQYWRPMATPVQTCVKLVAVRDEETVNATLYK